MSESCHQAYCFFLPDAPVLTHEARSMAFSPSSHYSDTSSDTSLLSPLRVQSIHNLADYDHQWDPNWREGSEEQHLYIFNRLPPPEGVFIVNLFTLLSRFGRILDVTTFEGMEYDNLTRRFPCYAISMGITHSDPSDGNYAVNAAKQMMVELRLTYLRDELGVHAIVERVLASEVVPGLDEPLGPFPEEEHEKISAQAPPRPQRPKTPLVQEPIEEPGSPRHDRQAHRHSHGSHEGGSRRSRLHEALRLRVEKHKPKYLRSLSDSSHKRDGEE